MIIAIGVIGLASMLFIWVCLRLGALADEARAAGILDDERADNE